MDARAIPGVGGRRRVETVRLNAPMGEILRRTRLITTGTSSAGISRAVKAEKLQRVARGAYVTPPPPDADPPPEWEMYRTKVLATAPNIDAVLSHESAAALHDIPFLWPTRKIVHFTIARTHGGGIRQEIHVHPRPLRADEITLIDGLRVTTRTRTAIDIATTGHLERAVCAIDAVRLRRRFPAPDDPPPIPLAELVDCLERLGRRRGVAVARQALALSVQCSESAGESWSRMQLLQAGLAPPRLQSEHRLEGRTYFADFDWGPMTGEFDGLVKYGATDAAAGEALESEKARHEVFAAAGIEVVRWGWKTLLSPGRLPKLITLAMARNGLIDAAG